MRLQDALAPFFFELPRCFAQHTAFFRNLGVLEHPSLQVLTEFLGGMGASVGAAGRLTPNQAQCVVRMLERCAMLQPDRKLLKTLFLPTLSFGMVPAKNCVLVDSPALLDRLNVSELPCKLVSPLVPERLCRVLELPALSALVHEELVQVGPVVADQQLVIAAAVVTAIRGMLAACARTDSAALTQGLQRADELGRWKVTVVSQLRTRFVFGPKRMDVTRTSMPASMFLLDHKTHTIMLNDARAPGVTLEDALAMAINALVAVPGVVLPLAPLLRAPAADVVQVAAMLALDGSIHHSGESGRGVPGEPVMAKVDRPVLRPTRCYYDHEIVCVRNATTGALQYARIMPGGADAETQFGVRVTWSVDVGGNVIQTLRGTEIWSFDDAATDRAAADAAQWADAAPAVLDWALEPQESEGAAAPDQPASEAAHAAAEANMFLRGVEDLLQRAHLSLSTEAREYMARNLALQQQLEALQTTHAAAAARVSELEKANDTVCIEGRKRRRRRIKKMKKEEGENLGGGERSRRRNEKKRGRIEK